MAERRCDCGCGRPYVWERPTVRCRLVLAGACYDRLVRGDDVLSWAVADEAITRNSAGTG